MLFFMRARPIRCLVAFLAVVGASCGGRTSSTPDAAPADAPADTPTDTAAGCTPSSGCSPTEWCKLDKTCGSTAPGTCAPRPASCTLGRDVCGSDGRIYPDECNAQLHGADVSDTAPCGPSPAPKEMRCGYLYCDGTTEYCQVAGNDAITPGTPCSSYACMPLPAACNGKSDCTCFPTSTPCSSTCKYGDRGFTITCMGG
jgi:hypothetical protein